MARICVIGAGFAGHTAALYLGDKLGRDHQVTVINRSSDFVYIPSLVWVGIDRMDIGRTLFDLEKVYRKLSVAFIAGKATEVHPDGQFVMAVPNTEGSEPVRVDYDYLLIATGPKLDFEATPGLGPAAGNTWSICSPPHAIEARDHYLEAVSRMEKGERQRIVIGTGHGGATCQGAACIASMGDSLWDGSAAVIMVYPVVPDNRRYPNDEGRDPFVTHLEMGLAGAWMKRMIHTTFMHKLQGRIGWKIIPE